MKRILSILISWILAGSLLVGCNNNTNKKDDATNNVKQEQQVEKKKEVKNKNATNKENTNKKEQTEKTNPNIKKTNTSKKVQQKKKTTNNEENDQICAICGEFVPMSDMCERNGKPVHYECIGAKKDNGDAIDEGESGVHRYGIDGKEQTEGDWNRQNSYINNGYSSHIDDNGDAYWTDDEGNEYR